MTKKDTH